MGGLPYHSQKLIYQWLQTPDGICLQIEANRSDSDFGSCADNDLCRRICVTRDLVHYLCHCTSALFIEGTTSDNSDPVSSLSLGTS